MNTRKTETFVEVSTWHDLIKTILGAPYLKHSDGIIFNVLSISCGLKPSFLFDYGEPQVAQLCLFVDKLHELKATVVPLHVLVVGQNLFIANLQKLCSHFEQIQKTEAHSEPMLINVSECLDHPMLADVDIVKNTISGMTSIYHEIKTAHAQSTTILHLKSPPTVNMTTLYGVLLNFPVVYWYDWNSNSNCLSFIPLYVYELNAKLDVGRVHGRLLPQHCFSSFSVPVNLEEQGKEKIKQWENDARSALTCQSLFSDIILTKTVKVLPQVIL